MKNRNAINKQVEKVIDRVESQVATTKSRCGKICGILFMIFGIILATFSAFTTKYWFDNNRIVFQSPIGIEFYTPVIIQDKHIPIKSVKQTLHSPVPTNGPQKQTLNSFVKDVQAQEPSLDQELEHVYTVIRLHESNNGTDLRGLNGYCVSQNKINQVGFDPKDNYCFDNETDQYDTVILWFKNRITGVKPGICTTIDTCLAVYNSNGYTL